MGINTKKSNNFYINERTGEIYLKNPVDYEESQINLIVEARDLNGQDLQLSLASYSTVEITILDYNDNVPEISVSFLSSLLNPNKTSKTNQIYIQEHIDANKFIAHVSVTDKDSNENGHVNWAIYINNEQIDTNALDALLLKTQALNNNSFILSTGKSTNKLFDRELYDHLNLSIYAWDNGQPKLENFFNFTINLIDINDNAPQFNRTFYNLTVYENNQVNRIIYKFEATDADIGENANIKYSLKKYNLNTVMPFKINNKGYLYALASFDREQMDDYRFYVIASDSGKHFIISDKFPLYDLLDVCCSFRDYLHSPVTQMKYLS
jgi:protocadherin delta 2